MKKLSREISEAFDRLDRADDVLKFDQFEIWVSSDRCLSMHCMTCGKATGTYDFAWATLAELIDDAAIHLAYHCKEAAK